MIHSSFSSSVEADILYTVCFPSTTLPSLSVLHALITSLPAQNNSKQWDLLRSVTSRICDSMCQSMYIVVSSLQFLTHLNIFQGYDASGLLVCRELEIIQTVVVEDEPPPLPALVPPALFPQPALLVRIEERVHEVIAIVLRDLERLRLDAEMIFFDMPNKLLTRNIYLS